MIVSGHQPAYWPWLGYVDKLLSCDVFIWMDDVQFTTSTYINHNDLRGPHGRIRVSVPLAKTNQAKINEMRIKGDLWRRHHRDTIRSNYRKSSYWPQVWNKIEPIYDRPWESLVDLNYAILEVIVDWFSVSAEIIKSSTVGFKETSSRLLLEHVHYTRADVLRIGAHGIDYINMDDFTAEGIKVEVQNFKSPHYSQRWAGFEPNLSVLDYMFNCGRLPFPSGY